MTLDVLGALGAQGSCLGLLGSAELRRILSKGATENTLATDGEGLGRRKLPGGCGHMGGES
jgi:hypothetical protein